MEEKKQRSLALAIKFVDGKTASQMKVEGLNHFEVIGLLMFQILTTFGGMKKETIKKGG